MSDFKRLVLVDFDGVIHSYKSGWKGIDNIPDPPVNGAIEWLNMMISSSPSTGIQIAIYSSRSAKRKGRNAMKKFLKKHGLRQDIIDCIKFPKKKGVAWLTIDDRCLRFNGTFPDSTMITDFKPWFKKDIFNAYLSEPAESIVLAAMALFDNRLGWSDGRNPYAPSEFWINLGTALYGSDNEAVKDLVKSGK